MLDISYSYLSYLRLCAKLRLQPVKNIEMQHCTLGLMVCAKASVFGTDWNSLCGLYTQTTKLGIH